MVNSLKDRQLLGLFCIVVLIFATACKSSHPNPNASLTLEQFQSLDSSAYRVHPLQVRTELERLALHDHDSTEADIRTRKYYLSHQPMLWVDRLGADDRADTILAYLTSVSSIGFRPQQFGVPQIKEDLRRLRQMDFDDSIYEASKVIARLEYKLTKGYLRFIVGQRFGFTNPKRLLNRLDFNKDGGYFRTLFDLPIHRPDSAFYHQAFHQTRADSLGRFLRAVQPNGKLYKTLLGEWQAGHQSTWGKQRLMVNLERARWRMDDAPELHQKYVIVNIPSYHLQAHDGDSTIEMRIGVGTLETKTPLLLSQFSRMDVNPQWIIPMSIIRKSIVPHAGNRAYFASHHYFIRHRATRKTIDPAFVTADMLRSGKYMVVQEGGAHNALGRIIFRFANKFSVYLHDTSSRHIFSQQDRGVSHGCVRVEYPYDLGVFLLENKDSLLLAKMRYSMAADVSPVGKNPEDLTTAQKQVADTLKRRKLVSSISLRPKVPLFIIYYTLYPNTKGVLESFNDVYGYDSVIYRYLHNFL